MSIMRSEDTELKSNRPSFSEEQKLWNSGYKLVAGLDEVGRGTIAGPVVTGLVILPESLSGEWVSHINDSKRMTPKRRQYVLSHLQDNAIVLQTGISSVEEVDQFGIVEAVQLAMKRSLLSLSITPQFLLMDAFEVAGIDIPQKAIVRGDSLSMSIAAASILAKETRDSMMIELHETFPEFGFDSHKGYGTKKHIEALKLYGPCSIHRRTFRPVSELSGGLDVVRSS